MEGGKRNLCGARLDGGLVRGDAEPGGAIAARARPLSGLGGATCPVGGLALLGLQHVLAMSAVLLQIHTLQINTRCKRTPKHAAN